MQEGPIIFECLDGRIDFLGRDCTAEETARLVELHDRLLANDPDRVDPRIRFGLPDHEPSAAIAFLVSPIDLLPTDGPRSPAFCVAALYCGGHVPGAPLADALKLGRKVTAWVSLEAEHAAPWYGPTIVDGKEFTGGGANE